MSTSKYLGKLAAVAMAAAVLLVTLLAVCPEKIGVTDARSLSVSYADLFDPFSVMEIDISVDGEDWQEMLDNALSEEYISCDLTVNGTTYYNVGVRPKGNTSLTTVASSDSDRFSLKFEFDHYVDGQTCEGLDKFVVNNIQNDTTWMKEYLSYQLLTQIGVPSPLYCYAHITVNGEEWGLYLAIEALEDSFAERVYGLDHGQLYKVEGSVGGGGMDRGGMGGASGGDLIYTGDDESNYSAIFDNSTFDSTDADHQRVIEALKALSEGENLEQYFDVDEVLRYLAANAVLVNLDSYFGTMEHNYYLYEEDGQLSILPWDYNLSFAGFQSGSASSAVNFPIDTPVSGVSMEDRPLISQLLAVPEYQERYHAYLQEILDEYFNSGLFLSTIRTIDNLIGSYVQSDPTAFYTYEEYQEGVETLKEFGLLRAQSIEGQLNGSIPSTSEGQQADSSALVDAGDLSLTAMGTQGGGGGGMGRGQMASPQEEIAPDAMSPPDGTAPAADDQPDDQPSEQAAEPSDEETQEAVPPEMPEGEEPFGGMEPPETTEPPEAAEPSAESAGEPSSQADPGNREADSGTDQAAGVPTGRGDNGMGGFGGRGQGGGMPAAPGMQNAPGAASGGDITLLAATLAGAGLCVLIAVLWPRRRMLRGRAK